MDSKRRGFVVVQNTEPKKKKEERTQHYIIRKILIAGPQDSYYSPSQ